MDSLFPGQLWVGRLVTGVVAVFLLVDALGKLMRAAPVVEGTLALGYPESSVLPIGVLLLVGVVLHLVPRTAVVGAIYLSAYLGGAVASHHRVGSPLPTHVLFPVYTAILLWVGLGLRNPRGLSVLIGGH